MNRFAGLAVILAGALTGCTPTDFIAPTPEKAAVKPPEPTRPIVRPPITAGQINAENAQEKAKALRQELDRDMEQSTEVSETKVEKK
jgi:hypothetical protein